MKSKRVVMLEEEEGDEKRERKGPSNNIQSL